MTDKKKAYMKSYREKHKEDIKEYSKKYCKVYYEQHKEEIKERAIAYNLSHKEKHKESAKKCAKNLYKRALNDLTTKMYKLPEEVSILDDRHIKFGDTVYIINKKGYLTGGNKLFHIEYAKILGIWFYGCQIHHIDGSTLNNTKENLIALTPEEHRYAHFLLKENKEQYKMWLKAHKVG